MEKHGLHGFIKEVCIKPVNNRNKSVSVSIWLNEIYPVTSANIDLSANVFSGICMRVISQHVDFNP